MFGNLCSHLDGYFHSFLVWFYWLVMVGLCDTHLWSYQRTDWGFMEVINMSFAMELAIGIALGNILTILFAFVLSMMFSVLDGG